MAVGTLEEIIDDNHAIVSTSVGSEYYVNMLSFVDKDLIEPGCTVLLNNKVNNSAGGKVCIIKHWISLTLQVSTKKMFMLTIVCM